MNRIDNSSQTSGSFKRIYFILLGILLLSSPLSASEWVGVAYVVDGDTIILTNGERIRYIGIDAPEVAHENTPAEPFGDAAHAYNRQLTERSKVRLAFGSEERDRYDRQLAYVFLEDGTFVNQSMLASGLAVFLFKPPNLENTKRLLQTQRQAMTAKAGLWRALSQDNGTYLGNRKSQRFHLPNCPFGRKTARANRVVFLRQWDAYWEGYAPCRRCLKK